MKKFLLLFANIVFIPFGDYSQVIVKNIEPGTNSSYPTNFYPFKDKLVFSAYTVGNNKQLYITDGTNIGTQKLTNLNCLNCAPNDNRFSFNSFPGSGINLPGGLTDIDSLGYFFGVKSQGLPNNPYSYTISVFKTDGTIPGTKEINLTNDTLQVYNGSSRFFKWNNMICAFVLKGGSQTICCLKLFVYNPLNQTYYYKKIIDKRWIYNTYTDVGNTTYIYNNCLYYYNSTDSSIYSMDFLGNMTFKKKLPIIPDLSDVSFSANNNSMITDNKLLFAGSNGTSADEPYFYDFVTNTTGILKDVNPYFNYHSSPKFLKHSYFHKSSEKISYFIAENPDDGKELYVTDGTPGGTILTRNTYAGTAGIPNGLIQYDGVENYYYHGDTIFSVNDSIRYYYKNSFYANYQNSSIININTPIRVLGYFNLGSTDLIHTLSSLGSSYNPGSINNTKIPSSSYSLSFQSGLTLDLSQNHTLLPVNTLFLKKDSCYYFSLNNGVNNNLTGYELYKYCNSSMTSLNINQIVTLQNYVSIFPNPSTSQYNFKGLVGENTIQIIDITGRILICEKTVKENHTLKLDAADGIYFYKIIDKQNRIQHGKLILK